MGAGVRIDEAALRAWPLPRPDAGGDKESRGRVLVIGGSRELAGAAILAGTAALRAGAGKLMLAVSSAAAPWVAQALPEARVAGLDEAADGAFTFDERTATLVRKADALLVGPGMAGDNASFMASLLSHVDDCTLVLDAGAMEAVAQCAGRRCLITPHAGEMAHLLDADKRGIERDPAGTAVDAARRFGVVVALKGPLTCIADPQGRLWRHEAGIAAWPRVAHRPSRRPRGAWRCMRGRGTGWRGRRGRSATWRESCRGRFRRSCRFFPRRR
jgi:ADP-dependent NAD(P)H-hydrate dehydratase